QRRALHAVQRLLHGRDLLPHAHDVQVHLLDEDRDADAHAPEAFVARGSGRVERKVAQRAAACAHGTEAQLSMKGGGGHCSFRDRLRGAVISHRGAAATTRMRYPLADSDWWTKPTPPRIPVRLFTPRI